VGGEDSKVIGDVLMWFGVCLTIVVLAYVVVRVGSFAYFKTKLGYLRAAIKEMRKEGE
jgi:hypothetical protein